MDEKRVVESVEIELIVVLKEFPAIELMATRNVLVVLRNESVDTPPPKDERVLAVIPRELL